MKQPKEPIQEIDNRIQAILVTQIYSRVYIGIAASISIASILVFIMWDQVPHWKLLSWFYIVMLFSLLRIIQRIRFRKVADGSSDGILRWGRMMIYGLGAMGLLWGSTAIFLFPAESLAHQAFLAMVLGGMVAGAVGAFSPIMPAFLAFGIPVLALLTVRFAVIGDSIHIGMAAMTLLFAILTFTTARRSNLSINDLVQLKETFSQQLERQTARLRHVNEQLQQEIEERRHAEQALADSKRRLTDIIEFLPDPTWVINVEGNVIAWNRAVERMTGIDKKDMVGKGEYAYALPFHGRRRPTLIDLVLKRNNQWEADYLVFREENGLKISAESFNPALGNSGRYLSATASRLYDTQGNVVGAIESLRDITEAKRTEKDRERLIAELQKAIAEVRTLSGMLPICSHCKKIRDDKGYWNQIENYISEHSDAQFSHSLCPECVKKLYPYLGPEI